MKVRVVKKGKKYIKKYSLDTEDWLGIIIVLAVLGIAIVQFILWS